MAGTQVVRRAMIKRVLRRECSTTRCGVNRLTARCTGAAGRLGVPSMTVQRIWRKHDIRPHCLNTHMVPNDPEFEAKAVHVIGDNVSSHTTKAVRTFLIDHTNRPNQ